MEQISTQSTKNEKKLNDFVWFKDLKVPGQSRAGVILSYLILTMPIISFVLLYAVFLFSGQFCSYLHVNILPIFLASFGIFLFICFDIPNAFLNKKAFSFGSFVKDTLKNKPETIIICAMFVWILLTGFFARNFPQNFAMFHTEDGWSYLQESLIYFIFYFFIFLFAVNLKYAETRKNLLKTFIFTTTVICIITLIFHQKELLISYENNTNWANCFVNSNHMGYILCLSTSILSITFGLSKTHKWRIVTGLLLALHLFVSMFNDTLGALVAITVAIVATPIVVCIKEKHLNLYSFIPFVMLVAISYISIPLAKYMHSTYNNLFNQFLGIFKDLFKISADPLAEEAKKAGTNRWELWLDAFKAIKENPLFGDGDVFVKPHNEYLQFAAHSGIVAGLLYIAGFVVIAIKGIKYFKHLTNVTMVGLISVMAYAINACFGNTMPHTYPFFLVILGITIASLNNDIKNYKSNNRNTFGIEKSFEFVEDPDSNKNEQPSKTQLSQSENTENSTEIESETTALSKVSNDPIANNDETIIATKPANKASNLSK
mgnify:FL=1